MTSVTVIGAEGFVGSAFVSLLSGQPALNLVSVTRRNYRQAAGMESDVVIEAACNSKKYLADDRPVEEFELSVAHRLRTLRDFPARMHVHISSVDVYSDLGSPETTSEDSPIDLAGASHYGFHKLLAEQLVQHYADRWLIARLSGMVGPGLRKNPVYDILHGQPLRIHPESRYQFMNTKDAARLVWSLIERGIENEAFNICGEGLISPGEIAHLSGREMNLSLLPPASQPRIVNISNEKIKQFESVPYTRETVAQYLSDGHRLAS